MYDSDKSGRKGHISRVAKYGRNTATGSLSGHLFTAHDIDVRSSTESGAASACRHRSMEEVLAAAGLKARSGTAIKPAASSYEFNRDLCLTFCVDLMPFSVVAGRGFKAFCQKNMPRFELLDESTLRRGALLDLYASMKTKVKNPFSDVMNSNGIMCIMFDGWVDKHHGRPYLGLRAACFHPETWKPCMLHYLSKLWKTTQVEN